jgi:tetratricopeptide (TPR) repeat protein
LTLQPSGPVDLTGATGQLTRGGRTVSLDDAEATLDAGNTFTLAPSGERLDIKVRPAPVQTRGFLAEVPAPASAALVGAGAAAALLAAVAIGLLRNVLRRPELADVERAIEEGSFRKAAYLAARILARRPGDESVLLGRAIALTKSGRPEQAVREVDAHLRGAPASDGSLHYVLGLAQLDLGRDAEGRAALREAVRLTPSLHTDVAPRLGSVASKETHGYA